MESFTRSFARIDLPRKCAWATEAAY